jgi:hypothetical protein
MKYISIITLSILFIGLISCEKDGIEANRQWEFADPIKANLKVVNAYTSNIPAGATGVGVTRFYIYQNVDKLNGNALSTNGSWPGSATYASVNTGETSFNFVLDRRVGNDYGKPVKGDTAFSGKVNLQAGKFYTMFMIGEAPTQTLWTVEDKLIEPKENFYAARFVNLAVYPASSPKPIDIYSRREKRNIVSKLEYKAITEFIEIPLPDKTIGTDTLDVRDAGTTKNLYSSFLTPTSRRSYTFYNYGRGTFATDRLSGFTSK